MQFGFSLILVCLCALMTSCSGARLETRDRLLPAAYEKANGVKTKLCSISSELAEKPKSLWSKLTKKEPDSTKPICDLEDLLNGKKDPRVPDLKFPVDGGTLSSAFGYRRGVFHAGVDICASKGEPILACADGRVVFTGTRKGYRSYGNLVIVDHGKDVYTHYAHMSRITAKRSKKVAAGECIGFVGSTGRSTSPHLHLEVKAAGSTYNPMLYFQRGELNGVEIAKSFTGTPMGPVSARRKLSSRP